MTTWYRTGTVALTNGGTAVTGTGTAFIANANVGDAFHAADGRVYEIAAVISDTSLTLQTAYQGTTQSGLAYAIQPTRGFSTELLATFQAILASQAGYVNGPLAGRFGDGTAGAPGISFTGDTDTGLHRPAANQIAASVAGVQRLLLSASALNLTVPITGAAVQSAQDDATAGRLLTVGAFGLGSTAPPLLADLDATGTPSGLYIINGTSTGTLPTGEPVDTATVRIERAASAALTQAYKRVSSNTTWKRRWNSSVGWGPWYIEYGQTSVLGTAAIASGIPTGALIERGINANGRYVRFADGTQVCSAILPLTYVNSALLSGTWTFPAAFLNTAELAVTANLLSGSISFATATLPEVGAVMIGGVTTTTVPLQLRPHPGVTFGASDDCDVTVMALGRWA